MKQYFLILIIAVLLFGCASQPDADFFKEGDICVLRTGNKDIIVSRTKDELDKIIHLAAINDNEGIGLEIIGDRAFMVDAETSVKVIITSYTVSQIRIESGIHATQSGWVPNEFIKK